MRVVHVSKKLPPLIGGDATAVAALARAQRRAGSEVDLVAYNAPGVDGPHTHPVGPSQHPLDLDRITLRRIRGMAALRRWARTELGALRPNVVHAHAVDVGYAVAPVARKLDVPTLLTCHGVWFPTRGPASPLGVLERTLIRRGRYAGITSVDAASVAALRSVGFPFAQFVPNGVDLEEFAAERSRDGPVRFLFAGRHEPQKGLDVLIHAAARVRDALGTDFAVDLAGHGSVTDALREQARRLGVERVVRFLGPLSRHDLVQAFRSADAFVLPSRHEGFPMAILEAWAARLPVVATRVGGIPDVCTGDTAVLVPPDDPDALADALVQLVRDANRRDVLAREGHRLSRERFGWDAVAGRYLRLYESLPPG